MADGDAGSRRFGRVALAVVCVVGIGLVLFAAPASAAFQWPFQSSFDGSATPGGSFNSANSIAVDDFNGDAYVADTNVSNGARQVLAFGSSNTYLPSQSLDGSDTPAGGFGGAVTVAANNTTGDVYVSDEANGVVDVFDSTGAYVCQITGQPSATTTSTSECAVKNGVTSSGTPTGSFGDVQDVAVDQGTGDIYVSDQGNGAIDVFSSSGTYLRALTGTPSGPFSFVGPSDISIDAASGHVFVMDTPFQAPQMLDEFDTSGNYITTFNGSNTPQGSFGNSSDGVAVDPATGDIFVSANQAAASVTGVVDVLDPAGAYLGQITGTPTGGFGALEGSTVGQGRLYLFDNTASLIDVFNATPVVVPDVTSGSPTNVTPTSATLNGTVNPDAIQVSDCHFAYIDAGHYNPAASDPYAGGQTVPCNPPPGNGSSPVPVTANLSGLSGGTTYHFRLVASNANGTNTGSDVQFGPPALDAQSSSNLAQTSATLNAQANPNGLDTTCKFEYVDHAHYDPSAADPYSAGQSLPCNPADLGSGTADQSPTLDLSSLQPGTTYHWRTVLVNAAGTTDGPDQALQTVPAAQIDSVMVSDITPTSASLHAQINPLSTDTSYQFQYGTDTSYGTSVPATPADLGSGSSDVAVSQTITGLQANTTYHFRVVATNSVGTAFSGDHTFTYTTTGGALPDDRAYEMVTPNQKHAATIEFGVFIAPPSVAPDGSRVMAHSITCFAGSPGCTADRQAEGQPYLFGRTPTGWVTTPLAPPATLAPGVSDLGGDAGVGAALFSAGTAPGGEDDYYVSRADGSIAHVGPISPPAAGAQGAANASSNSSSDFSHIAYQLNSISEFQTDILWPFDSTQPSVDARSVYEYVGSGNSQPSLVGVTGGAGSTDLISVCSTILGAPGNPFAPGEMSANGSTVFFTAKACGSGSGANSSTPVPADQLYARIDGKRTVLVSGRSPADCTTSGCQSSAPQDAAFFAGSDDGSKALFTSAQQLTDSATQGSSNLYLYDFANPVGHELIDVSAGDTSGQGPGAGALALSADGSHVYFIASGVLTTAPNGQGQFAEPGASNLYVYERDAAHPDGGVAFIAALSPGELSDNDGPTLAEFGGGSEAQVVNVSPDGRFLVFVSRRDLTADDSSQTGAAQVFRYDAQTGQLIRVSIGEGGFNDNGNAGDAALCAGQSSCEADATIFGGFVPHKVAGTRRDPTMADDGGRVFFQSPVGLTPQALNLVAIGADNGFTTYAQNLYEWEQPGSGSCPQSRSAGCVYLISDGKDTATLGDAQESDIHLVGSDGTGENVFFTTTDQLVPQDTDGGQLNIFDARVGGGFPYNPPPEPCTGGACQGTPGGPPPVPTDASVTFSGPGNAQPGARAAKPRVLTRTVHGATFVVRVKVPGGGRITIAGRGIRTVHKSVSRAGTYRLRVTMTARDRRLLARRHELRLRLRVSYAPPGAGAQTAVVRLTVKSALRHQRRGSARRATIRRQGGSR